jgi:probable HAF family extracellular repeat protein
VHRDVRAFTVADAARRAGDARTSLTGGRMHRILFATLLIALSACSSERQPTTPEMTPPLRAAGSFGTSESYVVDTLPSLAGTSRGSSINDRGWVAGLSTTSTGIRRAALWTKDSVTDLGALGTGPTLRSTVQWLGQNNTGMVVGISQTDDLEQHGETWSCQPFLGASGKICLGFYWENGVMDSLPTLGGPNGYAAAVNNRGQIVGWAETAVVDPTCTGVQLFQFRAVLWEPKREITRELQPYPGDSTSAATAINQRGQAVGISGDCDIAVGNYSARRAVIWDHRGVVDTLPTLGGEIWHTPTAINDSGHVVGFSNPTGVVGRTFLPHAFLWTGGSTSTDLGLLPGDDNSQAFAINNVGQIVGVSCLGNVCRGFLYDGVLRDLKSVVAPDFPGVFLSGRSITDDGRITGNVQLITGEIRAFVATPRAGG